MKNHEKILQMIETADPSDAATLDEIDARVWCYLKRETLKTFGRYKDSNFPYAEQMDLFVNSHWCPEFTRSRDALKYIRPHKFSWENGTIRGGKFYCSMNNREYCHSGDMVFSTHTFSVTEELTELYAIIQAIAFERGEGE